MHARNAGATYIAGGRRTARSGKGVAKWAVSMVATLLAFFVLVSGVGISPEIAFADPGDSSAESQKAADDAKKVLDSLDPGIPKDEQNGSYLFNQVSSYDSTKEVTSLQGLLWSVFGIRYINNVKHATVAGSSKAMAEKLGISNPSSTVYACKTNARGAGTAYYHNCDVPNLMTEFLQDSYALFDRSGVQNGEAQNAYAGDLFGIPKNLPGDGQVPVNSDFRSEKYTGLELYGYSLPWTTYLGEWDHIKTQSEARLLSNFGFFDKISLTGSAVGNSISSGLAVGVDNFNDQLGSNGNVFKAIGGFFSGYFQGSVAGGITPILDSSDLNVLVSFAWYRVGYANTAYGMRQLTDAEMAAAIRLSFIQILTQSNPANAVLGDDLLSIADGGKPPRKPIAKCEVMTVKVNADGEPSRGKWDERGKPSADQQNDPNYTGIKRDSCESQARESINQYKSAKAYDGEKLSLDDFYKYDADGNRKADTAATWAEWNGDVLSKGKALGIDCSSTYSNGGASADSIWSNFKDCWGGTASGAGTSYSGGKPAGSVTSPYAWNKVANKKYEDNQAQQNNDWVSDVLSQVMIQSFLQKNQDSLNFNAPWRRYVCTNADGTDMQRTVNGVSMYVYAFNADGGTNPACNKQFRAPIQNGLFGNGYTGGVNQKPALDTRHISNFGDPMSVVFTGTLTEISTQIQGFGLGVGQFATKLSSEVISWTYSPILDSLGLTKIISNLIKGFRDSIFFPLAFMLVAAGAIQVLFRAFKNQAYREGFTSIILMCLVFISGTMLMYKTDATINFVQKAPATVEQAVVGNIFKMSSVGNDELCTSTNGAVNAKGNIFGKLTDTSSAQATRELICNNWRVFDFTPWVYGQYGADFKQLYANGATGVPAGATKWKNTNGSLVGDAAVNMGNGVVVKNWALYQLDTVKTGTATTADTSIKNGRVDPNFYRIVDAQFGPNNGAGTETRYGHAWSGADQSQRWLIAAMSPILAVFGSAVVIAYSVTKIAVTTVSTLMLVFLPFAFLLGLFPSKRPQLKDYLMAIVGMMIQRVVLIIVLSIFFVLLLTFAGAGSGSYFNSFLMGLLICALFWFWRKSIMGYVFKSIGDPNFGRMWRENPSAAMKEWPLLKTVAQKAEQLQEGRTAVATAALGSVFSGRAPIKKYTDENGNTKFGGAVLDELRSRNAMLFRVQRRSEGFEGIRSGLATAKEIDNETKLTRKADPDIQRRITEILEQENDGNSMGDAAQDLHDKQQLYDLLKVQPGYTEISKPRYTDEGQPMLDRRGNQVVDKFIVADDDPSQELMAKPTENFNNYEDLMKPQDRRLVERHAELEDESLDIRKRKVERLEKVQANPDVRVRNAYSSYSAIDASPALKQFKEETDLRAKAKLEKKLDVEMKGDMETIFRKIDNELSDAEGFTNGDRSKVKKLIRDSMKDNREQEGLEFEIERIEDQLRYVAKQEYIASDSRKATKEAIRDMTLRVKAAGNNSSPSTGDENNGGN